MALKRGLTGEIKQTSSSESVMTVMAPIVIVFLVAKWGTDGRLFLWAMNWIAEACVYSSVLNNRLLLIIRWAEIKSEVWAQ